VVRVLQNAVDDTFELFIDRSKITKSNQGLYTLQVKLLDGFMDSVYDLMINLKFNDQNITENISMINAKANLDVSDLQASGEMLPDPGTQIVTYFDSNEGNSKKSKPLPRIKQPVAVVKYASPSMKFTREEPTINNIRVDNRLQVVLHFSENIIWPIGWTKRTMRDGQR